MYEYLSDEELSDFKFERTNLILNLLNHKAKGQKGRGRRVTSSDTESEDGTNNDDTEIKQTLLMVPQLQGVTDKSKEITTPAKNSNVEENCIEYHKSNESPGKEVLPKCKNLAESSLFDVKQKSKKVNKKSKRKQYVPLPINVYLQPKTNNQFNNIPIERKYNINL